MSEKVLDVVLDSLEPQQLAHTAGAEHVVPHQSWVGQRVESNEAAVAGEGLLARKDRMT